MGMMDMLLDAMPPEMKEAIAVLQDPSKRAAMLEQITTPLNALATEQGAINARLTKIEDALDLIHRVLYQFNPDAFDMAEALRNDERRGITDGAITHAN